MKFLVSCFLSQLILDETANAFTQSWRRGSLVSLEQKSLYVSIGIGPEKEKDEEVKTLIEGVDYEIPDHEQYRTSRRSKIDEQCDKWFESLMGNEIGILGSLAENAKTILTTPVPLVNDVSKHLLLPFRAFLM